MKKYKKKIKDNVIKPRKHPGIIKLPSVRVPDEIKNILKNVFGDTPVKQLINESSVLSRFLHSRQLPVEEEEIIKKQNEIKIQVEEKLGIPSLEDLSSEEVEHLNKMVQSEVKKILKQRVYNWTRCNYNRHMGLVYIVARAAPQYAVMKRVFQELQERDKEFKPKTLFDFGSGIGTVTWAARNIWNESIKEYFCVDTSASMNDLAKEILDKSYKGLTERIFFRQFLPSSNERKYDIVVSSYSHLELTSLKNRILTLSVLWQKTEQYLVLVEYGTMAGFKALTEARNILLEYSKDENGERALHVVAPCPHDLECPRVKQDHTPCNFQVPYFSLLEKEVLRNELYSYIIFKKGAKSVDDPCWPRIVRPVLNRSRHSICRMCTRDGNLQEIIFTPTKHDKMVYKCARVSNWGDILPFNLETSKEAEETA